VLLSAICEFNRRWHFFVSGLVLWQISVLSGAVFLCAQAVSHKQNKALFALILFYMWQAPAYRTGGLYARLIN